MCGTCSSKKTLSALRVNWWKLRYNYLSDVVYEVDLTATKKDGEHLTNSRLYTITWENDNPETQDLVKPLGEVGLKVGSKYHDYSSMMEFAKCLQSGTIPLDEVNYDSKISTMHEQIKRMVDEQKGIKLDVQYRPGFRFSDLFLLIVKDIIKTIA